MPSSETSFQIQMPNNETCIFSNVKCQIQKISFCILLPYRQWNVPGAAAAHSGKVKDKSKTNYFHFQCLILKNMKNTFDFLKHAALNISIPWQERLSRCLLTTQLVFTPMLPSSFSSRRSSRTGKTKIS